MNAVSGDGDGSEAETEEAVVADKDRVFCRTPANSLWATGHYTNGDEDAI